MTFTLNLSGMDAFRVVQLDISFSAKNPNYLEDAMSSAKNLHDQITRLLNTSHYDNAEVASLMEMYDGFKQYYLCGFL